MDGIWLNKYAILAVTSLGFMWYVVLLLGGKLSERQKKAITFLAFVGTWIGLTGLVVASQIPSPTNYYLVVAETAFVGVLMFWAYQGERFVKGSALPRLLRGTKALFVLCCFLEGFSVYNLFFSGYLGAAIVMLS